MSSAATLALLGVAVFVVGTPHGALDGRVGRRLLTPSFGSAWLPTFVLLYGGVAGLALLLWMAAPALALAGFLVLGALHFGNHDSPSGRTVAVLTRGLAPPVLAATAHPSATGVVFGWLAGPGGLALSGLLAAALPLWLAGAVTALAIERRTVDRLLLFGVAALFVLVPPLVAFALYFALIHTPAALREAKQPGESWGALTRSALPFSVAAVGLAAVGFATLRDHMTPELAFVRTTFWWLGALTVPHMGLALLERAVLKGPSPFALCVHAAMARPGWRIAKGFNAHHDDRDGLCRARLWRLSRGFRP